tara:strand:- start:10 stop:294 length:285 start_codon:yes stop_codon:yes gene_type:complete
MNKINNKFVSDWGLPIIAIGGLIIGIYLSDKITFIPDLSFCYSYPNIICEIPIIRWVVKILDTRVIVFFIIYLGIISSAYLIFKKLGFKESKDK